MQIYQIRNKKTNKSYVGKSTNYQVRFKKHLLNAKNKINRRLYDSINYHGEDAFELILLEDLGDCTSEFCNEREKFWIKTLDTMIPNGYNMTDGGDGGNTIANWPEEKKKAFYKRQADKRKGRIVSSETRKKISDSQRGKIIPDEQKELISKTNKERGVAPPKEYWIKQGEQTRLGIPHSEETKSKLSEFRTGKTYEELMDSETANRLKEERKSAWSSEKNPNYVEFSTVDKIFVLELLSAQKYKMSEISKLVKISDYKIRQFLREIGVSNFQQLGYKLSTDEWCIFWSEKLCILKLKQDLM